MRSNAARTSAAAVACLLAALAVGAGATEARAQASVAAAPSPGAAPAAVARLANVGATRRLEVVPLVDWKTQGSGLRGEAGVSYLVRTDRNTVLFDVGGNLEHSDPSPLMANMRQLGIRLADIDTIVISHAHMDHVGGRANAKAKTFSLDAHQGDLAGKRVFVPEPMTYPGLEPVLVREPMAIAPGMATIGPIGAQLFIGHVDEQALAIRVEGKGIVLIVGCGHQGLGNLLDRTAQLFDEPLYGVIGGLHYPVPAGRWRLAGIDMQRWATWGPFAGPGRDDVQREIDRLARKGPQWVSLSPHDSSDETIEAFRRAFGPRYHDLRVGEPQVVAGATR